MRLNWQPGDIVVLGSGDRVPADRFRSRSCRVEEAALTGESTARSKGGRNGRRGCSAGRPLRHGVLENAGGVRPSDRHRRRHRPKYGIGHISEMLAGIQSLTTPLLRKIDRFGRWLAVVILVVAAATFLFGTLGRGHAPSGNVFDGGGSCGLRDSRRPAGDHDRSRSPSASSAWRGATPSSAGCRRSKRSARSAVICSDKTGTLTRNEMTVQRVAVRPARDRRQRRGLCAARRASRRRPPRSTPERVALLRATIRGRPAVQRRPPAAGGRRVGRRGRPDRGRVGHAAP